MMLIVDETRQGPVGLLPERQDGPAPDFLDETVPAAFRLDNTVGSSLAAERVDAPFVSDYDPFADLAGYEGFAESFIGATSPDEVAGIKRQIDRENRDRETLAAAGWSGVAASMAAGLIDPLLLLPVGGTAATTARTGNVLRGGLVAARAGFIGSTAAEALLHTSQETRTWGESAANVAGATFLSGVAGAAVNALAPAVHGRLGRQVESDMEIPADPMADPMMPNTVRVTAEDLEADTSGLPDMDIVEPVGEGGSAGAMAVNRTEARLVSAYGLEHTVGRVSPMLRTATSSSIETRRTAQELVETPYVYEDNALGISTPIAVETRVKLWEAPLAESVTEMYRLFARYRTGNADASALRIQAGDVAPGGRARRGGKLTIDQFREEVGRAMRREDQHAIPEVAEAARLYRRRVFDPLKERAIASGLLPEDVKVETAASYLSRVWNIEKLNRRRPEIVTRTKQWLAESHPDLSSAELQDVANQIIETILTTPAGRIRYETIPLKRAPALKERTFNIPDELVEDFLESDVELISRFYTRTMAPDVELAARFGRADMDDQLARISEEYASRIVDPKLTEKQRAVLARRKDQDLRDIGAMRDRLRGTYGAPANPNGFFERSGQGLMRWNYIRLLGSMTVSAFPDVARPVMVEGMMRTFGGAIVPMVRNFKTYNLAVAEARKAATGLDMVLDSRALELADIGDDYGRHTKFERGLAAVANRFGTLALMSPWNAAVKGIGGVVTAGRILEDSARWTAGGLGRKGVTRLAAVGVDEAMARRIASMFERHGETTDGLRIANTEAWTDWQAREAFRSAILREVDRMIVTPGIGDRPLVMSSTLGKLLFQFQSFGLASVQRVLISGLQGRDAAFASGLMMVTGMGMMTYYLRSFLSGYEVSDDPRVWLLEGIDRAGVLGYLMEVNNITEKVTRGQVGLSRLAGGSVMSRYYNRSALNAVLGPSAGTFGDATQAIGSGFAGDWQESDTRALRRLIPFQNLAYTRNLLDMAEEGLNREVGAGR